MKWNANQIAEFLNIYQQYPTLWNTKHKDYSSTKLKEELLKHLCYELAGKGLLENIDEKQLKSKVKSIKDVYRQELNKIEKSKRSGCGAKEVYTPKLIWFKAASFLGEVLSTGNSKSNLDLSQNSHGTEPGKASGCQGTEPDEISDCKREYVNTNNDEDSPDERKKRGSEESFSKSPTKMRPPLILMKKFKKRTAPKQISSEISDVIHQLDRIARNAAEEKPYDQFGKFVAAELRQLPYRQSILLQQEIQNSIIRYKLNCLEHEVYGNAEQLSGCSVSPSTNPSLDSRSVCSNDECEVLSHVMINTFGQNDPP